MATSNLKMMTTILMLLFFLKSSYSISFTNNSSNLKKSSNELDKSTNIDSQSIPKIVLIDAISKINNNNKIKKTNSHKKLGSKSKLVSNQIYTPDEVFPIKLFLEIISSSTEQNFCIKRLVGKPQPYKSYKCPTYMKIYEDDPNVCIKNCPEGMVRTKENCSEECPKGFYRKYDVCVNTETNQTYKPKFSLLVKSDPICLNGYFSDGLCYTCLNNSEHTHGQCLTPCFSGSPSDNFCSYTEDANKKLSLINEDWGRFLRELYEELYTVLQDEKVSKKLFSSFKNLKEIANYLNSKSNSEEVQKICGKVVIFLREKFKLNIFDDSDAYLRSMFFNLIFRFEDNSSLDKKDRLSRVVDNLMNFSEDYTNDKLNTMEYGLESLPQAIANFIDRIC